MLAKRIIPCLDIKNGRVVKGVKFKNLRDAGDPVEVARRYDTQGADEIAFLDISASNEERRHIFDVLEAVAQAVFIPLTAGGGVRSPEDVRALLLAGADKVSINSAAVTNPKLIQEASDKVGSQCIVVAIDCRRNTNGWEVFTHGGQRATGINAVTWARQVASLGAGEILLTSMDQDGTCQGFDLDLIRAISETVDIPVIASGGVGHLEHLVEGVTVGGANAVLAASIFHDGRFTIVEAKHALMKLGIPVRMKH